MYKNGLKHSALLLLVALPISITIGFLTEAETGSLASYAIIVIGAIYYGYTYYPKYGPLILSSDGSALKKLFYYSMGFGTTFGILYILIVMPTLENINIFAMLLIACLAIPLTGLNFIGAFAIGRFLNK